MHSEGLTTRALDNWEWSRLIFSDGTILGHRPPFRFAQRASGGGEQIAIIRRT